ncbi:hypothetical protein GALMADRAFT_144096 [Galerina marginata CBS 339.88]|uniref:Galactose oxidase-like Early set domain-containing protein n=1 Tax=Galerina marginata (strain CBS 339.88) TaxID=685588 RepID=A0A067SJ99_GALM3|nr:hypothetical protein GALMADRAFT_144096 [Galerina marginata CBS 339.88]
MVGLLIISLSVPDLCFTLGSIFVSGSNPNADYTTGSDVLFPAEYRTEKFLPLYYSERCPQPMGLISRISYGGLTFNVVLDSDDLFATSRRWKMRLWLLSEPGFRLIQTNMGQRMIVLQSSYTGFSKNTATPHISQVPPNPSVPAPGPAFLFVVVKAVPSVTVQVIIGSGKIEARQIFPIGPTHRPNPHR